MKTIHEIRRARLAELANSYGGSKGLSECLDKSQSQISQWINASKDSKTGKPRGIADDTAREIERKCGKTRGWMDNISVPADHHDPSRSTALPAGSVRNMVPLISWVTAGEWADPVDNFQPGDAEEWMPCPPNCNSNKTFVLEISGDSMDDGSPHGYHDGEMIFVDCSYQDPAHNTDVVIKNGGGKVTFKRLIQSGDQWYLKPLNPNWPDKIIELDDSASIVGKVMFSGKKR